MDEPEMQRIEPGMDVCDLDGKKLGSVVDLRPAPGAPAGPGSPAGGEVVEVKTGFLGLGKHYYIPLDAVRDVTEAGVFLRQRRDELDTGAWEQPPAATEAAPAEVAPTAVNPTSAEIAARAGTGPMEIVTPAAQVARPASDMTSAPPPAATPATAAYQAPAQEMAAVAANQGTAGAAGSWEDVAAHYRSRWEDHYAQQGASWETYEPRYRFAWEQGRDPALAERGWYLAQPALREAWEARHAETPWDQVSDTVRDAWEHPPEGAGTPGHTGSAPA